MISETKRAATAAALLAFIAVMCAWLYFSQTRAAKQDMGMHQRIGEVLAEQTAGLIGAKGKIVTLAIETKEWPELATQIEAFNSALKKLGTYEVRAYEMDTKEQPKYGAGSGLSGRRYVRTVNKNEDADVFVSFVGAPKLSDEEIAEMKRKPQFVAESRSLENLPNLFRKKLIAVAVVSRFQFPSPGPDNPQTPQDWFAKRFQVITAQGVGELPVSE